MSRHLVLVSLLAGGALLAGLLAAAARASTVRNRSANDPPAELEYAETELNGEVAPDFQLADQNGEVRSLAAFRGRAVALGFLDPLCTDSCPLTALHLRLSSQRLGKQAERVTFVAINVNPNASVAAGTMKWGMQELTNWHFLTGPRDRNVSARSYSGGLSSGGAIPLPGGTRTAAVRAGMAAPAFTLQTLDGRVTSLQDYRGQAVMVNFWATWCPPCHQEMPDMQQVYEERKDRGFAVLAVNVQEAKDPIAGFVRQFGLTFPVLMDFNGEAVQQYGVYALPSSYFINREGRIAEVHSGPLSKAAIGAKLMA